MNLLVVFVAAAAAAGGAIAQTCNPAIDGTYCSEQMPARASPIGGAGRAHNDGHPTGRSIFILER